MEKTMLGRLGRLCAALLMLLAASGTAWAQTISITGAVTSEGGNPLRGVTVRALGTDSVTLTNATGRYTIHAPANGTLHFSILGQRPVQQQINGRTTIDVRMERIALLDEVVVTAYSTEERRGNITGAVASVNTETMSRQTTASVLQRLDAVTPGVRVENSGSPGSRSTVRIRGISSFQNNDPLYIVDGTPLQDSFINFLNPNDISSVQVLKDASAASIYGSRASNGVVIIETTKRGAVGAPQMTLRARTGVATPVKGYDDFLIQNWRDYAEVVRQSYANANQTVPPEIVRLYGDINNPTLPKYTYVDSKCTGCVTATDAFGRPTAVNEQGYSFPNVLIHGASEGTNWWDAVFGPAPVSDYNLEVAGGGVDNRYAVSANYFDQEGTAAYNRFRRGSLRANTSFTRRRFTFGENVSFAMERSVGGIGDGMGENTIMGKNILSQPIVPVYDVAGNFASGKGNGLGNNTNPLKFAWAGRDNLNRNERVFGNVFAGVDLPASLNFRTTLGFNLGQGGSNGFNYPTPENSEPNFTNSIFENTNRFTDFTWSNTLRGSRTFFTDHNLTVLLGQEANQGWSRSINGSMASLITTSQDAWYIQDALGDASTKNVSSGGGRSALLSFFGKADYSFMDRYIASFTVRKDGSSRLGPENRWGTFPAFGLGWRVSEEGFLKDNRILSDVMVRYGWGVTGNQQIPAGRIVSGFGGGRDQTFYDIGGSNSILPGYRQTSLGNPNLKWEENRSSNIGFDVGLFEGALNVVVDLYQRTTDNLLFDPPQPATAGQASFPILNIGKMENKGVDFSLGHRGMNWGVSLTGSHYRNKIVRIDGQRTEFFGPISTRFGNQVINRIGEPIGAFYGLKAAGLFRDAADVAAHPTQAGKAPGRIKFLDMNGDGNVTLADRTIIGSPHPDLTAGLDADFRFGNFDVAGTIFGSFGNDIFDVQKEFYVFRNFSTNVRKDRLTDSWTPEKTDAKYPRLDVSDTYSYQISSFYVEDGSYVRMRNVQVGYTVPTSLARWMTNTRIYLQAENLFTITGYDGLDPALPATAVGGAAGDIRDQYRGVDRGSYPSNRTFSIGLSTSF